MLDMRRNHQINGPEPYHGSSGEAINHRDQHSDRVQTDDVERLRYGMVVAADRVPDRDGIRHAETVSLGPPPTDVSGQGKQIVAIGDYDVEEQYTDDEGYRTDDTPENQGSFDGGTPNVWSAPATSASTISSSSLASFSSPESVTEVATNIQQPVAFVTSTITTLPRELEQAHSGQTPPPLEQNNTSTVKSGNSNGDPGEELGEAGNQEGLEEEEEDYENSEELFFWRPEGRRNERDTAYSYYSDDGDATKEYAL
ncbi:unnamed protein product [Gongylonema pulchrum]|uniref:Uncharacterized protein n=1 Tax=Gongylonema pulchrum TaxID=637853 RepID=A0A3P7M4E4_9BILA|nr:unnamed protein product [Gongylonema pulchrum]